MKINGIAAIGWYRRFVFIGFFIISIMPRALCQVVAFPGAEGYGKNATGGRGGYVIEVTNLNDDGQGSLRDAIDAEGARTVVFRVSGTIFLESTLRIDNDSITIAGQTAPGYGITLANYNLNIDADNVIIRYIRSRLGDNVNQEADAMTCIGPRNVIIDHCSFSWGIDETASCYGNENFTMQWCIISESFYYSVHSKGPHGYGGIWGGANASFHHNLLAHHSSRNPRFNGARYEAGWDELTDYRNNVIYNWGFNSAYGGEPSEVDGSMSRVNMASNYYKSGPATNSGALKYRIVEPYSDLMYGYGEWYIDSNYVHGYPDATSDNWTYGVQGVSTSTKDEIRSLTPFDYDITTIHTAEEAYDEVVLNAGACLPRRDTIDKRIIYETITGTATYGGSWGAGTGIIDSQNDVGGWPVLFSAPAPVDTDHDGMPDDWEIMIGLDYEDDSDRNGDINSNGYTNLEDYLNSITEFPDFILPPTELTAQLIDKNSINLSWTKNGNNYDGFIIERKTSGEFSIIDSVDFALTNYADTGLLYETTYYYRVRTYSGTDTSVLSNTANTTTLYESGLPHPSSNPAPADEEMVYIDTVLLSWKTGLGATSHDIYLGLTNPPDFVGNQTDSTYTAEGLESGETYYWRVDEVNLYGTTQGEVWTFSIGTIFTDALVGRWEFESLDIAYDSSGYENHGYFNNFTTESLVPRGYQNALRFNGDEQYVIVPDDKSFDFNINSFSVLFWMKQDTMELDNSKEYRYIVKGSNIENEGLGRSGKRYEVYYKAGSDEFCFTVDDNVTRSQLAADGRKFVTGEWTHVAAVRNTTLKRLYLYSNTSLAKVLSDGTGDISQGEDMYFGTNPDYPEYLIGNLDDIRLYSYALNKNEIIDIYNQSIATRLKHETTPDKFEFNIFPNPANSSVTITLNKACQGLYAVEIINVYGQNCMSRRLMPGQSSVTINIEPLNPGFYIVKINRGTVPLIIGKGTAPLESAP